MEQREIFEMIDSLYEPYLQVWQDVGNIESPTRCKALVDEVSQYFANMARQRGWKVDIMKSENAGDVVCITLNPDSKEAPICLSGHLDTVHAVGAFGSPAVHCDNEKIYGPGVTDCKGGVVAGFLAMDAVSRLGYRNRPVKLLLQTDEEFGSALSQKKTINYIIEQSKDAIAFLNLERNNPGTACLGRKGIVTFSFVVKGKAAHSSNSAEAGANAIVDAAYKRIELDKIKDKDGITCNCAMLGVGTPIVQFSYAITC